MKTIGLILCFLSICLSQNTAICDFEQRFELYCYEDILDQVKVGNSTNIILTDTNILLIDEKLQILSSIRKPQYDGYNCTQVISHMTKNIIFVICQQIGYNPYFAAYKYDGIKIETFGKINYLQSQDQQILKVKIIENTLLVAQQNMIIFYQVVIQDVEWYIKNTPYVLDMQFFELKKLIITDFDIAPYTWEQELYYRIFIVEQSHGILWTDAIVKTKNLIPFNSGNLNIKNHYHNIRQFKGVVIIQTSIHFTQFFVQTQGDGTFNFGVSFIAFAETQLQLYDQLNKYNDWNPITPLRYQNNVLAVSYQNYQLTVVTILFKIYYVPSLDQNNNFTQNPIDILVSESQNYFVLYFINEDRLVYKSGKYTLSICSLQNYNDK